jgi:hypothetical protein
MPTSPAHDYVGEVFGEFWVAAYVGRGLWLCVCSCGSERKISSTDLRKGRWKSCGCKLAAHVSAGKAKHGHAPDAGASPTYGSWRAMWQRCTNPGDKRWHRYGGRGITVCERWRQFDNFLHDMGERPEGKTIDRKNNDMGYSPDNCRWATAKEQAKDNYRKRAKEQAMADTPLEEWARQRDGETGGDEARPQ